MQISLAIAVPILTLMVGSAFAGSGSSRGEEHRAHVVTTEDGKFRCPGSAFSDDDLVDISLCTALPQAGHSGGSQEEDNDEEDEADVVCLPTSSAASQSGTAALQRCAIPGPLRQAANLGRILTRCKGGGDLTVTGGYDPATGALDLTITMTDCIDQKGATHNGTSTMQGTLIAKADSAGVYVVSDTKTVLEVVTYPDGGSLTRSCTLTRDGEYNTQGNIFTGKSTRDNCVLDGQYKFKGGAVDSLIENVSEVEDF